ncbi:hypothetical protein KQY27_08025 [Methanobrevibacter sp. TMH8]|uniref:hypothetical protein n=1 Tax=Methanobrevibacter sp. TMH8 TaxID=2848611 RepID=UPI001CCB933E|nr:hypothetical protein [Methanobrevibacter sp. TMH8]MBZ9571493.1 hypothetical protein [Methanobrevibacter sp. TMH8]
MDSRGISTVDFIFTIFLSLIIFIIGLNLIGNNLEDTMVMEEELNGRMIVDSIANSINEVNSNNIGHIQEITLPKNVSKRSFSITINQNKVLIEFGNRKGDSAIIPIRLANFNKDIVNEIKLYPSESYKIQKSSDDNNLTIIQIYKI